MKANPSTRADTRLMKASASSAGAAIWHRPVSRSTTFFAPLTMLKTTAAASSTAAPTTISTRFDTVAFWK